MQAAAGKKAQRNLRHLTRHQVHLAKPWHFKGWQDAGCKENQHVKQLGQHPIGIKEVNGRRHAGVGRKDPRNFDNE